MGAGSGFFLGMVGIWSFRVVGRGSGLAGVGGMDAAVVGHIAAQIGCHGVRHDQHRLPHRLRHALDGRQTRIALAAFNLRQMLRRHTHLGRQHLQRQTTLVALAAQEGGNQCVCGRSEAQWRENRSYDRVNSDGVAIFLACIQSIEWG